MQDWWEIPEAYRGTSVKDLQGWGIIGGGAFAGASPPVWVCWPGAAGERL